MKRIFFLMAVLSAFNVSMSAQNYIVDSPDNKPYIGLRAGVDITSTSEDEYNSYSNGVGFTAGAVYNIPVWKNLYFEPGVSLFYNNFGYTIYTASTVVEDYPLPKEGSYRNWGFRVPLNVGYHFDFTDDISIALFTGPVMNLNLSATDHFDGKSESIMGEGFKRFDVQWDFGIGMNYSEHYYVSLSGALGMSNVYKSGVEQFKRNSVNITLGYNF